MAGHDTSAVRRSSRCGIAALLLAASMVAACGASSGPTTASSGPHTSDPSSYLRQSDALATALAMLHVGDCFAATVQGHRVVAVRPGPCAAPSSTQVVESTRTVDVTLDSQCPRPIGSTGYFEQIAYPYDDPRELSVCSMPNWRAGLCYASPAASPLFVPVPCGAAGKAATDDAVRVVSVRTGTVDPAQCRSPADPWVDPARHRVACVIEK